MMKSSESPIALSESTETVGIYTTDRLFLSETGGNG